MVRVPQSAESIVHRANGVRNKLLTSDQPTYAANARGCAMASRALYLSTVQVRIAPIPSAVISGKGPVHDRGSCVSAVITTRTPTNAPRGTSIRVNTVLG